MVNFISIFKFINIMKKTKKKVVCPKCLGDKEVRDGYKNLSPCEECFALGIIQYDSMVYII